VHAVDERQLHAAPAEQCAHLVLRKEIIAGGGEDLPAGPGRPAQLRLRIDPDDLRLRQRQRQRFPAGHPDLNISRRSQVPVDAREDGQIALAREREVRDQRVCARIIRVLDRPPAQRQRLLRPS